MVVGFALRRRQLPQATANQLENVQMCAIRPGSTKRRAHDLVLQLMDLERCC